MTKIETIKKGNSVIYPITHINAIIDANGKIGTVVTKDDIINKQDKLESGTNIRTINGKSLLGEGNIIISFDDKFSNKQDVIGDLDAIRTGAALGATSLQADDLKGYVTESYVDEKVLDLIDGAPDAMNTLNELAAALKNDKNVVDTLNNAIGGKQDTLVSGTNIKTVNGESLLGKGDIEIQGGGTTTLQEDIQIIGGPLANNIAESGEVWPDGWKDSSNNKIIPKGKSLDEILTALFLKIVNGTVKKESVVWSPSLSKPEVDLSKSGTVEVGTEVTSSAKTTNTVSSNSRTCTFTCNPGYFLSTGVDDKGKLIFGSYNAGNKTVTAKDPKDAEGNAISKVTGTPSIITYWNGTKVTSTKHVVSIVGDNTFKADQSGMKAYAGVFDYITVYGSTNTKVPLESVKASISNDTAPDPKNLTSTNSVSIKGARAYWMGAMANPLSKFTSATIREAGEDSNSGLVKTLGSSPTTTLTVPAGQYDVVIATQKEVKSVVSKAQGNFEIGGNFTKNHSEVNIEGANGFTAVKYHVYHCNADWDSDILTITYK